MKSYIFEIHIEEDAFPGGDRAYHASCPALKGLYVEDLRESGEPIPIEPGRGVEKRPTPSVAVNV